MASAAALFGVVNALVKGLSADLSNGEIVFFRNAFGLVVLLPFLKGLGPGGLATRRLRDHGIRSLSGWATMSLSFWAYSRIPLGDAVALSYTSPLFMPLLARFWLREPWPPHATGVLALGFAGVLMILRPGPGVFQAAASAALLAGVLAAVAQVGIRGLTRTEPPLRIVFYFAVFATVLSLPGLLEGWRRPSLPQWGLLLLLGVLASSAQMLLTTGYKYVAPGRAGGMLYVAVAVSGGVDWLFWGVRPTALSVLGAIFITVAGIWIVHHERRAA